MIIYVYIICTHIMMIDHRRFSCYNNASIKCWYANMRICRTAFCGGAYQDMHMFTYNMCVDIYL